MSAEYILRGENQGLVSTKKIAKRKTLPSVCREHTQGGKPGPSICRVHTKGEKIRPSIFRVHNERRTPDLVSAEYVLMGENHGLGSAEYRLRGENHGLIFSFCGTWLT